ncbi:MAG: hypothetical protein K8S55_03440 [Phycisphaerae bacterium]|nr:hypothetical protein [Phycisphaerae bacterium]
MVAKKKTAKKKVATQSTPSAAAEVEKTTKSSIRKKGTRKKKLSQDSCFVLMPFKEPFEMYYDTIIKPAVVAANLNPLRCDSLFTPTPIMGDVWKMIQEAKVLVAELTGKNSNVFYELGLGHAIGKPIVLISETIEDVPFDLQPLRVILYDKDDPAWGNKLKNKITTAINDTIASPIDGVPPMFRKPVKSQAPSESETNIRLDLLEQEVRALSRLRSSGQGYGIEVGQQLKVPEDYTLEMIKKAKANAEALHPKRTYAAMLKDVMQHLNKGDE